LNASTLAPFNLSIRSYIYAEERINNNNKQNSKQMRMKIYTKHKRTAKELSNTHITVNRSECFNGYVPQYAVATVFNSQSAINKFDKDCHKIKHPTKGMLYKLPTNVMKFVSIV